MAKGNPIHTLFIDLVLANVGMNEPLVLGRLFDIEVDVGDRRQPQVPTLVLRRLSRSEPGGGVPRPPEETGEHHSVPPRRFFPDESEPFLLRVDPGSRSKELEFPIVRRPATAP